MNPEKHKQFRELLGERKRRLLQRAQEYLFQQGKLDEIDPMDYEDIASLELDDSFTASLESGDRDRLKSIEDAVDRLNAGMFGICEECGTPIAEMRLVARPEARLCAACGNKKAEAH